MGPKRIAFQFRLYAATMESAHAIVHRARSVRRGGRQPGSSAGTAAAYRIHTVESARQPAYHDEICRPVARRKTGRTAKGARVAASARAHSGSHTQGRVLSQSA